MRLGGLSLFPGSVDFSTISGSAFEYQDGIQVESSIREEFDSSKSGQPSGRLPFEITGVQSASAGKAPSIPLVFPLRAKNLRCVARAMKVTETDISAELFQGAAASGFRRSANYVAMREFELPAFVAAALLDYPETVLL